MPKYKVEVGSFCTRLVQRTITVYAENEDEAATKAIRKYEDLETGLSISIDCGEPRVDFVKRLN